MKLRTMLFSSAILLAIGANFAFTTNKQFPTYGYYLSIHGLCDYGELEQEGCTLVNSGPACTIFDPSRGVYVDAYDYLESEFVCEYPLYQEI